MLVLVIAGNTNQRGTFFLLLDPSLVCFFFFLSALFLSVLCLWVLCCQVGAAPSPAPGEGPGWHPGISQPRVPLGGIARHCT